MLSLTAIPCPYCDAPKGAWCVMTGRWTEENQHNFHPALAHVERRRIIINLNKQIRESETANEQL